VFFRKWSSNGNKPLHEWKTFESKDAITEDTITWVFDEDSFSPVAKIKGDKQYSILSDYLGTPTHVFDFEGDVIWETRLDSYGKMQLEKGKIGTCPFRYQGQYEDYETGLYYNRFRYYSPEEGQYLSQDPIGLIGGSEFYSYSKDTNIWLDVFGLSSTVLNAALGGVTGDKMQAHHVIPEQVWGDNKPFLDKIGIGGQRDVASNGVLLHDSEAGARGSNKAIYHNGSHDKYSRMVDARVKKIEARHSVHGDDARARQEIADLQNRLRKVLDRKSKGGCSRLS
jgi:RHS repeat-associated protein